MERKGAGVLIRNGLRTVPLAVLAMASTFLPPGSVSSQEEKPIVVSQEDICGTEQIPSWLLVRRVRALNNGVLSEFDYLRGPAEECGSQSLPRLTYAVDVGDEDFGASNTIDVLAGAVSCSSGIKKARAEIAEIHITDPEGSLSVTQAVEGLRLSQSELGLRDNGTSLLGISIDRGLGNGLYVLELEVSAIPEIGDPFPCRGLGTTVWKK